MPARCAMALLLGIGLLGSATGCTGDPPSPAPTPHPPRSAPPSVTVDVKGCPVTLPRPADPSAVPPGALFGAENAYGTGELWVGGLWPGGVIEAEPRLVTADGAVDMKFGWWRGVPGRLRITGRRLDGAAPPVRASIPDGYGDRGFQSTGVTFPAPGCWEVTGSVDASTLTFVTFVVKR
jgi:hypothetical protein